jgi:hypothetical protein
LKNSLFVPKSRNLGDRKCLGDPRKSLVGLPKAISFLRFSWEGVFQQPQAISLTENWLSHGQLVKWRFFANYEIPPALGAFITDYRS